MTGDAPMQALGLPHNNKEALKHCGFYDDNTEGIFDKILLSVGCKENDLAELFSSSNPLIPAGERDKVKNEETASTQKVKEEYQICQSGCCCAAGDCNEGPPATSSCTDDNHEGSSSGTGGKQVRKRCIMPPVLEDVKREKKTNLEGSSSSADII
ncbi:unnamed protein product [Heterosigma akashiwo]